MKNNDLLIIKNLQVEVDNKMIINNLNLVIKENELHAILGPNGNGKSSLLHAIMGNPIYKIVKGSILWKNNDITHLSPEKRAKLGIFLSWQNPIEVEGLSNIDYLKLLIKSNITKKFSTLEFYKILNKNIQQLALPNDFLERYFNVGFSGGEKKKNEILQMLILEPELFMLDEIDSGLDIDSIKIIKKIIINKISQNQNSGLLVSHYGNFLKSLPISHVHILINGNIVETTTSKTLSQIEKYGFSSYYQKYKLDTLNNHIYLENCGIGKTFKNGKS